VDPEISIGTLTITGGLASLFAEAVYQLIRQFSFSDSSAWQHLYACLVATLISVLLTVIVAFLVAYQVKRRRILMLLLIVGLALVVLNLLSTLFPS
jgi:ABC-type glycerol-3-phosphate transport system permease component